MISTRDASERPQSSRSRHVHDVHIALRVTWVVLLVAVAYLFLPASLGGPTSYVIVSGTSMEPTYASGDLLVLREAPAYEAGDVITYRIPEGDIGQGIGVVHRVVGGDDQTGLITQGDNKGFIDPWSPTHGDVLGKVRWHVPNGGIVLAWLRQPIILGALAASLAVAFYVAEDPKEPKRRRRRRQDLGHGSEGETSDPVVGA